MLERYVFFDQRFSSKDILVFVFFLSLAFSFAVVLAFHANDIIGGGNGWKQGDWLINNHSGFVRRGVLGSFFLLVSDSFHVIPVYVVAAFQICLVSAFYYYIMRIGFVLKTNDAVMFFLMCPLFLFFWSNDPQGSMRKEILAYLSFLPLVLFALKADSNASFFKHVAVSQIIFIASVLGHEANVLFSPIHVAMLYILIREINQKFIAYAISYLAISAIGIAYVLMNTAVFESTFVCEQVLIRGADPKVCKGAMEWLSKDSGDALATFYSMLERGGVLRFLFSYFIIFIFFVYILRKFFGLWRSVAFFFLSLFPFIPLYFVAVDWGRWMNFHVTSMVIIIVLFFIRENRYNADFSIPERVLLFVFCFSWGVTHVGGYFSIDNGYFVRAFMIGSSFLEVIYQVAIE